MTNPGEGHSFFYYLMTPFRLVGRLFRRREKPNPLGKLQWLVFGVILLALLSGLLDYPTAWDRAADWASSQTAKVSWLKNVKLPHFWNRPFRFGLDLQGGTHLVYEADVSGVPAADRASALDGVRDVIERRVNAFGVAEPVIQVNRSGGNWRIVAELAGIKDVKQAIQMIGETPILDFKEQNTDAEVKLSPDEQKKLDEQNAAAKAKASDVLKKMLAEGPKADFAAYAKQYSEDAATKDNGGDLGPVDDAGQYQELWKWANSHPGTKLSRELVETSEGYNIVSAGAKDTQEKEVLASHILICWKGATRCDKETSKADALKMAQDIRAKLNISNFAGMAKDNSTEPGAAQTGGDLGWFRPGQMVKSFEDAVFPMPVGQISQPVETEFGYHLIWKRDERPVTRYDVKRILFKKTTAAEATAAIDQWKMTGLTGKDLKRAAVEFSQTTGEPQVVLQFNDNGKKLFGEITSRNVGKPVAIFLDGQPISVPRVQQAITDGNAVITGNFDIQEAKLLAQRLNAGALPVPINLLSQQTVGASLGQDSLNKSLFAGAIGFLLVALFMIFFYRLPGLLATLALAMYTAFLLAIFKLVAVTLTLAGIAGVILSIGMAVDANILIFARMREELKAGRPIDSAINEGFKRAWTSIRDSNVSSLITCAILYSFTSSSVRGFAVTLALGILVSLFSAITVTRSLLKVTGSWTVKHGWLYR